MDGLSATASIIAVLQLTGEVIGYLKDVKDAPKDCQQCEHEASNLQDLLINLLYHLNQRKAGDTWYTAVRALNVENGPLDQYKQALVLLRSRVEIRDGLQKVKRRLLWRVRKEEVASILARMERLKSLVSIALEMDHITLSRAIKDDTTSVRTSLLPLQASAVTVEAGIDVLHAQTCSVKDDTISIRDALPPLQAKTTAVRDAQSLQQHQATMAWLSPTDFPAQQHDIISRRQSGTAKWFLDSAEFKKWSQGSDKTLFCPGIPGAGKTMMAAVAIDHLSRMTPNDDIGIAYLFCSYKAQVVQSAPNLFAAVLKQLVQGRPDIAVPVMRMHDHHSKRGSKPSLEEILETLLSIFSGYSTVYIVIDALDECTNDTQHQLIDKMRDLQASRNLRLLFTSRFIPEVTQEFQSNSRLEVRASEEDIRHFVTGQIPRLPNCIQRDEELKNAIQSKIVEAVDGMFLLARLHVDSFLDKRTKQKVLSTLQKLSKGSAALDDAYSEAIKRIDGQLDEDRSLAKRAICWISYAQRLLTTKELSCALAIEAGDKALNVDNIYEVKDIISVCAGLVTMDEESSIIRLTHYTTQEYFERIRLEWYPSAQEEIAVACLTYLSFDTFQSGSCTSDKNFEQRLAENPFIDYSAHYWSEHIRSVERYTSSSDLALNFLYNDALIDSTIQAALDLDYMYEGYSRGFPSRTNGLHLTARYGLLYLTEMLLDSDIDVEADSKDDYGQTPLSWAAWNGHEAVVKLLAERADVEADSKDEDGRTSLSWAAWNGHEAVVKLLAERADVEADSKDEDGRTPLSWAADNGLEAVVKLLVERDDVETDSKDKDGRTPLSWAAWNGHEAVVKLLAERDDVETDSKDKDGQTPLSLAAENGHEAVVKLLAERDDVETDSKDKDGQTPLSLAAWNGHEAVVKILAERDDVETDSKDKDGRTPLSLAT